MEKIKRDGLAAKIISFCMALALWFYVSYEENPNMTKTIHNVPISIDGQQALKENGFSVYSISDKSVDVSVTAKRLSFRKISNKTIPAKLNVSSIKSSGEHIIPVTFDLSSMASGTSFTVKDNDIKVIIEPIVQKNFSVNVDLDESGVSSLIVRKSSVSPKTVTVSAPKSIISEISSVTTQKIIPDNKNITHHNSVNVIVLGQDGLPMEGVECSPSQIDVSYSFYSVKTVPIKLVTTESSGPLPQLSQSEITIYGYGDVFDATQSISTEAINPSSFSSGAKTKVKLILPDGIKLTNQSSEIDVSFVDSPN